jgi:hypothetical protein
MPVRQRFQAQGDDGREYEILVEVGRKRLRDGSYIDTLPHLLTRTPSGVTSSVNVLEQGPEKGRYKVVKTGVILTSTDPNRF